MKTRLSHRLPHIIHLILIFAMILLLSASGVSAADRGIRIKAKDMYGASKTIRLYAGGYYALVIGCDDYRNGWPRLSNPVKDSREVKQMLKSLGWEVDLLENPTGDALETALNKVILGPGKDADKAVLIWFSGHGHTLGEFGERKLGYLVPVDAPVPHENEMGFMKTAVSMRDIETTARRIKSKHVLMLFDSCFSGALFQTVKAGPSPYIEEKVSKPVRMFITAGNENEMVPDQSVFKEVFIQGIKERYADRNRDGYVTGLELGDYLQEQVVNYSRKGQHPQFGKISDPKLDKGDFVIEVYRKKKQEESRIVIKSDVKNARIWIDGSEIRDIPASGVKVSPGVHGVRVEKSGYEAFGKEVRTDAGETVTVNVWMKKAPARLYVETDPAGAEIRILNIRPVFSQGMELEPGSYDLEVSKPGYRTDKQQVWVDAGEEKRVMVRLDAAGPEKTVTNSLGMKFVYIPPGEFVMGSPEDEPERGSDEKQHRVRLTKGFYMQTTEVTQGQWKAVMGNNPSKFKNCGSNCPVETVSWDDVQEFIKKLNRKEGKIYRLPTEAEWEYAARAGTQTPFAFGRCLSTDQANYNGNYPLKGCSKGEYRKKTISVGSFQPNTLGLYDMHGNVYEWCQDWYGNYPSGSVTDPMGPSAGSGRVVRGGGWPYGAGRCRSADRGSGSPGGRGNDLGFRLLRTP